MLKLKAYKTYLILIALALFTATILHGKSLFSPIIEVNNLVITQFELDQRVKLVTELNLPGKPSLIAKEQLIEERLKQIEAGKLEIKVSDEELRIGLERFASRINLSVIELERKLILLGIYPTTLSTFIETEILWQKIINTKFDSISFISDQEIKRSLSRAKYEDSIQVLLTEIIIPNPNNDQNKLDELIKKLKGIKSIKEFSSAAKKYSVAPTASAGGLIRWQDFNALPEIVKSVVFGLSPTEVSEVIRLEKAIAIFQLRDIREITDNRNEVTSFGFMTVISSIADMTSLESIQDSYSTCADLKMLIGDKSEFKLKYTKDTVYNLSKQLVDILKNLDPTESKIVNYKGNRQLMVLCERNSNKNTQTGTSENVRNQLETIRLNNFAKSLINNLKDSARIVVK